MISSGEIFILNGETCGKFQLLPQFLNQNIRVIAAGLGRAYIATEPAVCPSGLPKRPSTVWCFEGGSKEPAPCPEFDSIDEDIKQIAIGEKHLLVLTHSGVVYSRGAAIYGNAGHGGASDVPEFRPVPALKKRNVKFIAAGPFFSIAITIEGDVFSWGQAFNGETGLFTQVDSVPRFAAAIAPFRVMQVSCGHAHVLACTETQQCIAWGENTSGQLGLGGKSKPTYKPQVIDAIPSQIQNVAAGWAHSIAVGTDGRVYSWGLNTHGQLGLGDKVTRFAPHLLHALTGTYEVESAHASKVSTIFQAARCRPLLCGRIPNGIAIKDVPGAPRRPGESDPDGCLLCPVPLQLASAMGMTNSCSELAQLSAFDSGAIGFARSTVYKVTPNLAPVQGGTQIRTCVTGLPFERPGRFSDATQRKLLQDVIPVKVRLRSSSPLLDVVVPGKIVDVDTVEFTTPNVTLSPLGSVAEQSGCAAVTLQVSIDDGFTWTMERCREPNRILQTSQQPNVKKNTGRHLSRHIVAGIEDMKVASAEAQRLSAEKAALGTLLYFCRWPQGGPTGIEPSSAPVTGGTELLVHIQLPPRIPTDNITVKFVCKSLKDIGDPELEAKAPMRRDAADIINPCKETIAKELKLVADLDVLTNGWLDPNSRGVRCISPPLDADNVKYYEYHIELSLDGKRFLDRGYPFNIYDMRVTGLEPPLGPLTDDTEVTIQTTGLVKTEIQEVRLDFPRDLGWESERRDASYDHTTGKVHFKMPNLTKRVRRAIDEERGRLARQSSAEDQEGPPRESTTNPDDPVGDVSDMPLGEDAINLDGGLAGLEVFVELSLNGQNFTEDRVHFTYHGGFEPLRLKVLAPPDGVVIPEEPKAAKGGKKVDDSHEPPLVHPGSKLSCEVGNLVATDFAALCVDLFTKVGDEEPQLYRRDFSIPAQIELVAPARSSPVEDHGKKDKKGETHHEEEPAEPIEMLVAYAPFIGQSTLPDPSVVIYMENFRASMNGKYFMPMKEAVTWRLQPQADAPDES